MAADFTSSTGENRYFIDIEQGAETARLLEQERLFSEAMGGLLPELDDLSQLRRVLDIACGPGGWALELATRYPHLEIVGIDINPTMIDYALATARVRELSNVTFEVADARQRLPFHDAAFDLVNARLIMAFMDQRTWPALLAECRRLLRPGGIIRLTEIETPVSNSPAYQRLYNCLNRALAQQKRTFSVDGNSTGIVYMLARLLREAGFVNIQRRAFYYDGSYGMPMHDSGYRDMQALFCLTKPFLLASGVIDEAEFEQVYQQMLQEMAAEDYTIVGFGLTAWAINPSEPTSH
ncbi:MAG: class I SAM-dependent methyltransferase [Thermogemmatispora sp.]|uniref:class I SAM-dependent methyltransferase n=1 Tax=Thermogemmatispora sp. TaxID=1968838 RepID=UPI00262DFFA4|nr:class I SAM-dependent methyltransferase [Thermogemmatispora sp.]MBX5459402.1 class I SAM-dependent methyltransferase [Thermogemmatispora sp.]